MILILSFDLNILVNFFLWETFFLGSTFQNKMSQTYNPQGKIELCQIIYFYKSLTEHNILSHRIEFCTFGQLNSELGVDASVVFSVNIFGSELDQCCETIFLKDLRDLGDKRNAFTHSLNLDCTMLFEDKFTQKQSFVHLGGFANSVDIGFVELWSFFSGVHVLNL